MSSIIISAFVLALVGGIAYYFYKKKVASSATNVAVPNTGTPKPNPGVEAKAPTGATPTDPTVTTGVIGTVTESLTGRLTGNAPAGYVPGNYNPVTESSILDTPGAFYRTPEGVRLFTLPVISGKSYRLACSESYAAVTLTVTKPDGSVVGANTSGGGYAELSFVSDVTGYYNVTVQSLVKGGIEVYV